MLATALSKEIGYDATARITLLATHENIPLKEAALKLGEISAERFDQITDPTTMVD
jgi:fumarate hydratase class II